LSIYSPNINQFLKFFHRHTLWETCNEVIIEYPTNTLTASLHYLVKYKFSKITKYTKYAKTYVLKQFSTNFLIQLNCFVLDTLSVSVHKSRQYYCK